MGDTVPVGALGLSLAERARRGDRRSCWSADRFDGVGGSTVSLGIECVCRSGLEAGMLDEVVVLVKAPMWVEVAFVYVEMGLS